MCHKCGLEKMASADDKPRDAIDIYKEYLERIDAFKKRMNAGDEFITDNFR